MTHSAPGTYRACCTQLFFKKACCFAKVNRMHAVAARAVLMHLM